MQKTRVQIEGKAAEKSYGQQKTRLISGFLFSAVAEA